MGEATGERGGLGAVLRVLSFHSGWTLHLARSRGAMRVLRYGSVGAARAAGLETQLLYLRRRFDLVPLATLAQRARTGRRTGREVALTFDGGLRAHTTVAYPLLERLGIPATFFVSPWTLGCWRWDHEMRERLRGLSVDARMRVARMLKASDRGLEPFVEWMAQADPETRRRAMACLRAATPSFSPTLEQRRERDAMDWEDLRQLDQGLVTVGLLAAERSPTTDVEHVAAALRREEGRRMLERFLNRPVDQLCLAQPPGPLAFQGSERPYDAVVSNASGDVPSGAGLPVLPRIAAPEGLPALLWRMHRSGAR